MQGWKQKTRADHRACCPFVCHTCGRRWHTMERCVGCMHDGTTQHTRIFFADLPHDAVSMIGCTAVAVERSGTGQ